MSERRERPKAVSNVPVAIAVVVLLIAIVLGGTLVHRANPEATATFTSLIVLILGTGIPSVLTLVKVRDVEKQTNGRLHTKDEELTKKDRWLIQAGIDPQTGEPFTDTIGTRDK